MKEQTKHIKEEFSVRGLVLGFLVTIWLGFFVVTNMWPSSFWLDVSHVYVEDTVINDDPQMIVVRDIKRNFFGKWTVVVRKVGPEGHSVICTREGSSEYRTDSQLPDPLLLSWWAYPGCDDLEPGRYFITTTWKIGDGGFLPYKYLTVDSNIFEIYEPGIGQQIREYQK